MKRGKGIYLPYRIWCSSHQNQQDMGSALVLCGMQEAESCMITLEFQV